jgi:hypothetical protein
MARPNSAGEGQRGARRPSRRPDRSSGVRRAEAGQRGRPSGQDERRRGGASQDDRRRDRSTQTDRRRAGPRQEDPRRGRPAQVDSRQSRPGQDDSRQSRPRQDDRRRERSAQTDGRQGRPGQADRRQGRPAQTDGRRGRSTQGTPARSPAGQGTPPREGQRGQEDLPGVTEVLTAEVLDELRQTARPGSFSGAARALADGVLALSEDDPEAALESARAAKRAAPRSAAVRELLGIALYQTGAYKAARTELAAAQRISGSTDLTAILADVERATGRPEQAIELFRSTDTSRMSPDTAAELLIVAASAYGDLGEPGAGAALIRRHAKWPAQLSDYHLRLAYAEGTLAERAGDLEGAREAFTRVVRTDPSFFDAAERLEQLERARAGGRQPERRP